MSSPLHVSVVESEPPAGTPVAAPIGGVRVTFDGQVGEGSTLEVLDAAFARVDQGPTTVESENTLVVEVSDSASGALSVQYSAVDPHDGYASTGALTLNVLPAGTAAADGGPSGGTIALALAAIGAAAALIIRHRRNRAVAGLVVLFALVAGCAGTPSDEAANGAADHGGLATQEDTESGQTPGAVASGDAPASGTGVGEAATDGVSAPAAMTVILASSDLATGPERFAYGLRAADGAPIEVAPSEVTFFRIEGEKATPVNTVAATYYPSLAEGQPGLYVAHTNFDSAGPWGAEIRVGTVAGPTKETGTGTSSGADNSAEPPPSAAGDVPALAQRVRFEVAQEPDSPALGEAPPPTANKVAPASASADDLAAITSDPSPDPELYATTVDEARASGRPTVVVFATPAYCQTELCGPIVDEIKQVKQEWGDRANFIHIEVYDSFDPLEVSPIMASWGLSTEPWVFVLDADGNVSARLEGNVTAAELVPILESVVGTS